MQNDFYSKFLLSLPYHPKFLHVEKLKIEKELLDSRIAINIQRLAGKKKGAKPSC